MSKDDEHNFATILKTLDLSLKPKAFRRSGSKYHRQLGGVWHVIYVQRSREDVLKFTVNVGIAVGFILERLNDEIFRDTGLHKKGFSPHISSCLFQHRLGELMHRGDVWWSVLSQGAIVEIVDALEHKALPWLSLYDSEEAVRDELLRKLADDSSYRVHLQCAAVLLAKIGPKEELERILGVLRKTRYFDFDAFISKHLDLFSTPAL